MFPVEKGDSLAQSSCKWGASSHSEGVEGRCRPIERAGGGKDLPSFCSLTVNKGNFVSMLVSVCQDVSHEGTYGGDPGSCGH